MKPEDWRENLRILDSLSGGDGAHRAAPLVSIVDEAHALINPEWKKARAPAGFPVAFGPQAYHVIRASRVAVFLMDPEQSFRDRETTTRSDIEGWARELSANILPPVSLADAQFRLAGSVEYMAWLEHLLGLSDGPGPLVSSWRKTPENPAGVLTFDVVADPLALEEALRPHLAAGQSARMLASYAVPWMTAKKPKGMAGGRGRKRSQAARRTHDFDLSFTRAGQLFRWKKIWNHVSNGDYTHFVQAAPPACRPARNS